MATDINILIKATDQASPNIKKVEGEVKQLGTTAKNSSSMMGGLQNILKTGLTTALVGTAAAVGGLAFAFKDALGEARDSIETHKQLEAVIKSTGGAAGITAEAADELAGSLANVTNFGDDTILAGENMLLTFTNIGKDVFPRATETMLDMSQALGQDLKGSAVQLGKALNDPIAGISALSRVGVTFTDQQKEMIQTMVDANDVAGAQTLILDELAREFGGSARALADPVTQLGNAWGEVQEAVGTAILPLLNNLAQTVLPHVQAASELLTETLKEGFITYEDGSGTIADFLEILGFSEEAAQKFGQDFYDMQQNLKGTLNTITGNIQNAMGWIKLAWDTNWGDIRQTWETFATDLPRKQAEFWAEWQRVFGVGSTQNINDWEAFLGGLFGGITRWAGFAMDLLIGFLGNWNRTTAAWHALQIGDWSTFWSTIGGNFTTAFNLFGSFIDIFYNGWSTKQAERLNALRDQITGWWQGIVDWWNSTVGSFFGSVALPTPAPANFAIVNPANVGAGGGAAGGTVNNITVNTSGGSYEQGFSTGEGILDAMHYGGH